MRGFTASPQNSDESKTALVVKATRLREDDSVSSALVGVNPTVANGRRRRIALGMLELDMAGPTVERIPKAGSH